MSISKPRNSTKLSIPSRLGNVLVCWCLVLTTFEIPFVAGGSERVYEYGVEGFTDETGDDELTDVDWLMVAIFSLLFSFSIALVGSLIGYISVLDDSIIRRYDTKGELIHADIVSAEFARGGSSQIGACSGGSVGGGQQPSDAEYLVEVEYNRLLSENYIIRVRRQVRAIYSDFVDADSSSTNIGGVFVRRNINNKANKDDPVDPETPMEKDATTTTAATTTANTTKSPTAVTTNNKTDRPAPVKTKLSSPRTKRVISNQDSFLTKLLFDTKKLPLLVVPDKPKSGYPLQQIRRARTLRYRLSTVGFVVANLLLAIFCFGMAIRTIQDEEHDEHDRFIGWILIWAFVLATMMQLPLIHCFCYSMFMNMLEEEYYESADLTPTGLDDSSLSSGSDIFLHGSGAYMGLSSTLSQ